MRSSIEIPAFLGLNHISSLYHSDFEAVGLEGVDPERTASTRSATGRVLQALERENPAFAGDPAGLRDFLAALVELGFDHFPLVFPNFPETDDLELFVDEVLPAFR